MAFFVISWNTILRVGIPSTLVQVLTSFVSVVMNTILLAISSTAVAVYGVCSRMMGLCTVGVHGIDNGLIPIVAYNYGARKYARVRKTLKAAFVGAISFMTVCWAVVQLGSYEIAAMFVSPDPSESEARLVELTGAAMRIYAAALPAIAFGMVAGNFFQGTGKAKRAMFLNACRQLIMLMPMLLVFPRLFGLKGVFAAQPVSDALSAVLAGTLLSFELKHMRSFEASGNSADEKDRL